MSLKNGHQAKAWSRFIYIGAWKQHLKFWIGNQKDMISVPWKNCGQSWKRVQRVSNKSELDECEERLAWLNAKHKKGYVYFIEDIVYGFNSTDDIPSLWPSGWKIQKKKSPMTQKNKGKRQIPYTHFVVMNSSFVVSNANFLCLAMRLMDSHNYEQTESAMKQQHWFWLSSDQSDEFWCLLKS